MTALENPDENRCFGCGPANERGLGLTFELEDQALVTTHVPGEDETGWPGLMHGGLVFTVLFEVSYWACLELGGALSAPEGTLEIDLERLPPVGRPFTARAVLEDTGEVFEVEARAHDEEGRPLGHARGPWRPVPRSLVETGRLELPDYLVEEMV